MTSPTLLEALAGFVSTPPAEWAGEVHLHLGGKTGEVLLSDCAVRAVQAVVPRANVILHLHPHYFGIVEGLVRTAPPPLRVSDAWYTLRSDLPLALQVTEGLRTLGRLLNGRAFAYAPSSYGRDADAIHCSLYRCHMQSATDPRRVGFWRLFAEAAGVPDAPWTKPEWLSPDWQEQATPGSAKAQRFGFYEQAPGGFALVFPSGNIHTGGMREINLGPGQWAALAQEVTKTGLLPLATGHRDDPRREMPGWTWIETDRPEDVLALLPQCRTVLGLNSGIVWAATQLSPGKVTMIDTQGHPMYAFELAHADGVTDPARHYQIPEAEARERMLDVAWQALLP